MTGIDRAGLVEAARLSIVRGSQSFAAASTLFSRTTRERAWLLYCWCRAADDMTDGQDMGHGGSADHDARAGQARLAALTEAALDETAPDALPLPFMALHQVVSETAIPRFLIEDHLAGFALDAEDWQPSNLDDLLRYCYHVAGSVGCMMALIMGLPAEDTDTLDRACDLGIAFQLANIARDIVPDAAIGRCYIPRTWLAEYGLSPAGMTDPANRAALAAIASRLVRMARPYRASAKVGAMRLRGRSRLAILAAEAIYGAIGEKVLTRGVHAWDERVRVPSWRKMAYFARAVLHCGGKPPPAPREHLWQRPRHSPEEAGLRSRA